MNPNKDIMTQNFSQDPYISNSIPTGYKFTAGTDKFDWKVNAIKQVGVELSKNKKFSSLIDCFNVASKGLGKVRYRDFKEFMEETNALKGFNLTEQLLQQLFSELDPHKKGFLTESDWKLAFDGLNWYELLIVEVENLISS